LSVDSDLFSRRGRATPKYWMVRDHSSEGNHAWRVGLWLASPRVTHFQPQSDDFFMQPAASRIDDASHPCVAVKPHAQMGSAWKKQVASPVCLSQESRGFGLRDNRRCNPGSAAANEPRLGRSADQRALRDSRSNVPQLHSAKGLQGGASVINCC